MSWSIRTRQILGDEKFNTLTRCRVLVAGVGGVGGYAAEHLVRCGIGAITLVDSDTVDLTNCNRQIAALTSTVGDVKVEVLKKRFLDINPGLEVDAQQLKIPEDGSLDFLELDKYDLVLDAIDDVKAKVMLLAWCVNHNVPVVSSMGAAGKFDVRKIAIADISKTCGCPLARAVRSQLRKNGIVRGVTAVFSQEESISALPGEKPGSLSYLVAGFGSVCAQSALDKLLKKSGHPFDD